MPATYAVVAGGCDWPLPTAVGLSNNDVIVLRALRQFRYVPYVACVSLDGNPALWQKHLCSFLSGHSVFSSESEKQLMRDPIDDPVSCTVCLSFRVVSWG